jgi:hypothetical protein
MFSKYTETRDCVMIVCCDVCMKINNGVPITDNNMAYSAAVRRSPDRMSYSELLTGLSSRILRKERKAGWLLCSSLYKACGSNTSYSGDWISDVSEELVLNFRM